MRSSLALLLLAGCAAGPDPLTCDRSDPECMKAVHAADRRAERKRKEKECPQGAICIKGFQNIERAKRGFPWL